MQKFVGENMRNNMGTWSPSVLLEGTCCYRGQNNVFTVEEPGETVHFPATPLWPDASSTPWHTVIACSATRGPFSSCPSSPTSHASVPPPPPAPACVASSPHVGMETSWCHHVMRFQESFAAGTQQGEAWRDERQLPMKLGRGGHCA